MAAIHGPSIPEASKTLHQILFVPTKGGHSRDLTMSCVVHLARVSCRARYHQALRLDIHLQDCPYHPPHPMLARVSPCWSCWRFHILCALKLSIHLLYQTCIFDGRKQVCFSLSPPFLAQYLVSEKHSRSVWWKSEAINRLINGNDFCCTCF